MVNFIKKIIMFPILKPETDDKSGAGEETGPGPSAFVIEYTIYSS